VSAGPKLATAVATFAILGGGGLAAGQSSSDRARAENKPVFSGNPAAPGRTISIPWIPLATTADGRALTVRYRSAECFSGFAHATVRESRHAVTLLIRQRTALSGGCLDIRLDGTLTLKLSSPLAGRVLETPAWNAGIGSSGAAHYRKVSDPPHPAALLPLVPDLRGLNVDDALLSLRLQGFRARARGRGSAVFRETPPVGELASGESAHAPFGGTVLLTVR
jgi:hypothetical protein